MNIKNSLWSDRVMSVKVMSEDKLISMIDGREMKVPANEILFDSYPIACDQESNTLFIPQSLADSNWKGRLTADSGKLYFSDDAYLQDKNLAIREGHAFKLYCLDKEEYSDYNVVFTGMPKKL